MKYFKKLFQQIRCFFFLHFFLETEAWKVLKDLTARSPTLYHLKPKLKFVLFQNGFLYNFSIDSYKLSFQLKWGGKTLKGRSTAKRSKHFWTVNFSFIHFSQNSCPKYRPIVSDSKQLHETETRLLIAQQKPAKIRIVWRDKEKHFDPTPRWM